MDLWTNYEGCTVAGEYTLGRLRRSEGRNGFFTTRDEAGHAAVIRLTEACSDERVQLNRWRKVVEAHESNLIGIEKVGRTQFEGVSLTYALMEADDAVLDDVLAERPLSLQETHQVALSVGAALAALHARNLVHEHVDATNVLAVGDTVKLRSDCVSECVPEGEFVSAGQAAATRATDIHDFGLLLLRCLTLDTQLNAAVSLPEPFARIIPGALQGTMDLRRIQRLLAAPLPENPYAAMAPELSDAEEATVFPEDEAVLAMLSEPGLRLSADPDTDDRDDVAFAQTDSPSTFVEEEPPSADSSIPQAEASFEPHPAPDAPLPIDHATLPLRAVHEPVIDLDAEDEPRSSRNVWAMGAVAAFVLAFAVWHFAFAKPAAQPSAAPAFADSSAQSQAPPQAAGAPASQATAMTQIPTRPAKPTPAITDAAAAAPVPIASNAPAPPELPRRSAPLMATTRAPIADAQPYVPSRMTLAQPLRTPRIKAAAIATPLAGGKGWHVVVYSFRRFEGAEILLHQIAARHPELHPQIFVPLGQPLYLVSIGGSMNERDAQRLLRTARLDGLPPDTFAKNYR